MMYFRYPPESPDWTLVRLRMSSKTSGDDNSNVIAVLGEFDHRGGPLGLYVRDVV